MRMQEESQPPLQLSTARLLLRKPQPEDAAKIFERYAADPDVVTFLNWRVHSTKDDTRRGIVSLLSGGLNEARA